MVLAKSNPPESLSSRDIPSSSQKDISWSESEKDSRSTKNGWTTAILTSKLLYAVDELWNKTHWKKIDKLIWAVSTELYWTKTLIEN